MILNLISTRSILVQRFKKLNRIKLHITHTDHMKKTYTDHVYDSISHSRFKDIEKNILNEFKTRQD